jgi:hypothetical protein
MHRADWLKLSAKAVAAWLGLSALGIYVSAPLAELMLPLFRFVLLSVAPEYAPSLKLVADNHDVLIQLEAWLLQSLPLGGGQQIPAGLAVTTGTHLMHTLVPVVIEGSLLMAWPTRRWVERAVLLVFGVPTSILVVGLTGPFVLLGTLEIQLQDWAQQAHVVRHEPLTLTWMIFSEMGGRWVLAVTAAIWCIHVNNQLFGKVGHSTA